VVTVQNSAEIQLKMLGAEGCIIAFLLPLKTMPPLLIVNLQLRRLRPIAHRPYMIHDR
jgi:hypothetical protein